jgi:hypothetical protein
MNIEPILDDYEYDVWNYDLDKKPDVFKYDVIIACEPHADGWKKIYPEWKGKIPIIGLQQALFWVDEIHPSSTWLFDRYFVWGEQMREMATLHGCPTEKLIITGNPRFDKFFSAITEDKGFTLILGGGGEDRLGSYTPLPEEPVMYIPHPMYAGGKIYEHSEEMMRIAGRVMFRTTGGGIIPMIMRKPVRIMPLMRINSDCRMNGHFRFFKSKLYGLGKFGVDDGFVKWAVTGPGSIERTKEALQHYV